MTACYRLTVAAAAKASLLLLICNDSLLQKQQLLLTGFLIPWLPGSCFLLIWLHYAGLPSGAGGFAHDGHVVSRRWAAWCLRLDNLDKLLEVSARIFCGNISERHLDLGLFLICCGKLQVLKIYAGTFYHLFSFDIRLKDNSINTQ